MIWMISPREAFEQWFNHYHPSSLPADQKALAEEIKKSAGSGMRMDNEISQLLRLARPLPNHEREYVEAQATCAIFYQESGQLDHARESLAEALRYQPQTHEKAVISWMMGTVDLLRGRNLQAYRSLRAGVEGFQELRARKQRILNRRSVGQSAENLQVLQKHHLEWYVQQINKMNKVLAGTMQQALDWLNLKKWGHIRPTTAVLVAQMQKNLEHSDPAGERALLVLLEAGTQMVGTHPTDRERKSRMRARLERGDPARVREAISELLRLAGDQKRNSLRDKPMAVGDFGSPALEYPEVLLYCAWGFYEICDYDACTRLLRESIERFSPAIWMQAVSRWMLGIVMQQMPGFEAEGLAQWQRAAEQMEEHAWRADRLHDIEYQDQFKTIFSVMRGVLEEPRVMELNDLEIPLEVVRVNLVLHTNVSRFQKIQQERFLSRMATVLNFDVHQARITRLTEGSLVVTIQLPTDKALKLLRLYLNGDSRLLGLPESFHVAGIEPLPDEVSMGDEFERMEDELTSFRHEPQVGRAMRTQDEYLRKLLSFQDQRAQLTNPNRATVDIQYDEQHYYERLVDVCKDLRDFYQLNLS